MLDCRKRQLKLISHCHAIKKICKSSNHPLQNTCAYLSTYIELSCIKNDAFAIIFFFVAQTYKFFHYLLFRLCFYFSICYLFASEKG